jgi:hypothetical protein
MMSGLRISCGEGMVKRYTGDEIWSGMTINNHARPIENHRLRHTEYVLAADYDALVAERAAELHPRLADYWRRQWRKAVDDSEARIAALEAAVDWLVRHTHPATADVPEAITALLRESRARTVAPRAPPP